VLCKENYLEVSAGAVNTRLGLALVDICFTVNANKALVTFALVLVEQILAGAVLTGRGGALIHVDFTGLSRSTWQTIAAKASCILVRKVLWQEVTPFLGSV